ncbi:MAG: flagellar assembly protein FliW [Spirochaetaceae bacterium]|nr:flagellar assembly protein FliW [Spirochaetaceae bacterium]
MKASTKPYGVIEVDERQSIKFPMGLFGFESYRDFAILDADRQPFYWLQSLEVQELAFILVNPFLFRPDYELDISDEELKDIGISSPGKALVFSIVTIPADGGPMTANLQGPVIINREQRIGKQAVLADSRWKTRHNIVEELAAARKASC